MKSFYEFQIVIDINPNFFFPSKQILLDSLSLSHEFEMLMVSFGSYSCNKRPSVKRVVISFISLHFVLARDTLYRILYTYNGIILKTYNLFFKFFNIFQYLAHYIILNTCRESTTPPTRQRCRLLEYSYINGPVDYLYLYKDCYFQ